MCVHTLSFPLFSSAVFILTVVCGSLIDSLRLCPPNWADLDHALLTAVSSRGRGFSSVVTSVVVRRSFTAPAKWPSSPRLLHTCSIYVRVRACTGEGVSEHKLTRGRHTHASQHRCTFKPCAARTATMWCMCCLWSSGCCNRTAFGSSFRTQRHLRTI